MSDAVVGNVHQPRPVGAIQPVRPTTGKPATVKMNTNVTRKPITLGGKVKP